MKNLWLLGALIVFLGTIPILVQSSTFLKIVGLLIMLIGGVFVMSLIEE